MTNRVSVISVSGRFRKVELGIEKSAHFFLGALNERNTHLDIFLVSKRKMRVINRTHRGKNHSTNVLAFEHPRNFPVSSDHEIELGEIYLCPSHIKKHKEDIYNMFLHGILHLVGFNHENKSDRIKMEKTEEDLTAKWLSNKF